VGSLTETVHGFPRTVQANEIFSFQILTYSPFLIIFLSTAIDAIAYVMYAAETMSLSNVRMY
jgi:hypothetical protein